MITFLSGGTGTPKLIQGFRRLVNDKELSVSGLLDEEKYWGIKDDTYNTLSFLSEMGLDTWFKLGDKDIGLHLQRTRRIQEGLEFSKITQELTAKLKIEAAILPCTDNHIETRIITE